MQKYSNRLAKQNKCVDMISTKKNLLSRLEAALLILALITVSSDLFAQVSSDKNTTSDRILSYDGVLSVHPLFNYKFNNFSLIDRNSNGLSVDYAPNGNVKFGGGFFYDWLGFALTFQLPSSSNSIEQRGETSSFDTQINLYSKMFTLDLFQQNYKGFYIANYQNLGTIYDASSNIAPQRPDIRTRNLGFNFSYFFNSDKYSARAAYMLNEKQMRNGGSFIAGAHTTLARVIGDSAILSRDLQDTLGTELPVTSITSTSLSLTGGYAYTLKILKNFYFNISLQLGPMYSFSSLETNEGNIDEELDNWGLKAIFRSALGYNTKKFYGAIVFLNDSYNLKYGDLGYDYSLGSIRFFVGYRIPFDFDLTLFKRKIF
jgi:hypothetical protein